jgi:aspartyl-tRNA(Asn)/glutamyl-tRNA(Gln) amidotransferase subunit C
MANLDKHAIQNLIQLSRIDCSSAEQEALLEDLKKILSYVEQLNEIDTSQTAPCNTVLENTGNVMRPDVIGETLPREAFLANAPSIGGLVRIPPVMKQN